MIKHSNILDNFSKSSCFGCTACQQICAKHAISMQEDAEGFLYPSIDQTLCINCGACYDICPALNKINLSSPIELFACKHKELSAYEQSSSGAVFPALAKYIIEQGGIVCGAVWDKQQPHIKHAFANNILEVIPMQGSKYVQSNLLDTFKTICSELKSKKVLFSGTPCQVTGLKKLVSKYNERLYCVEVVCYGVASPKCFTKYIKSLGKVTQFSFRENIASKGNRFISYTIDNKKHILAHSISDFTRLYFQNFISRPSCHQCPYTSIERVADISLADLHNTQLTSDVFNKEEKASSIFINTPKGQELWQAVQAHFDYIGISLEQSMQPRIKTPSLASKQRQQFMAKLDNLPFSELAKQFSISNSKQDLLQQLRAKHAK